jgi:hypothetical protein
MNAHPECYGAMFPDFTRLKRKERLEGQAFAAVVMSSGTGAQGRNLELKREAWENCVACPDYRTCYDLSLAKLEMNDVLMNTMVANPWVGD